MFLSRTDEQRIVELLEELMTNHPEMWQISPNGSILMLDKYTQGAKSGLMGSMFAGEAFRIFYPFGVPYLRIGVKDGKTHTVFFRLKALWSVRRVVREFIKWTKDSTRRTVGQNAQWSLAYAKGELDPSPQQIATPVMSPSQQKQYKTILGRF
jgi:hypothetical protein